MRMSVWGSNRLTSFSAALFEAQGQTAADHRHVSLVVSDKAKVRACLAELGIKMLPGRFLDFHDPWGQPYPDRRLR